MSANGSTAIEVRAGALGTASGVAFGGVTILGDPNALTTCSARWNRSAGSLARVRATTSCSSEVTSRRLAWAEGTGSVNRFMMTAWTLGPLNGAEPVSIS